MAHTIFFFIYFSIILQNIFFLVYHISQISKKQEASKKQLICFMSREKTFKNLNPLYTSNRVTVLLLNIFVFPFLYIA